jgi:hypothetical protein
MDAGKNILVDLGPCLIIKHNDTNSIQRKCNTKRFCLWLAAPKYNNKTKKSYKDKNSKFGKAVNQHIFYRGD